MNGLRVKFLENCYKSDIIPRFLKFRVPNNGCFDDRAVREFQRKLLKKEIVSAKQDRIKLKEKITTNRTEVKRKINPKLYPSIIVQTKIFLHDQRTLQQEKLNGKLRALSEEQDRPLFDIENTVLCYGLSRPLPKYVMETLSLGPRNSVLETFDQKDILTELDDLLRFCKKHDVEEQTMTDINIKTLAYIKKCKKQKPPRNVKMTQKYLKDNELLAIPFDKGIGICVMKSETYNSKLDDITNLPQFEKVLPKRKNEKNPTMKEEELIVDELKTLLKENKIKEKFFDDIKPTGSQPPRLYGLAKIHKQSVPLRPVLSMPGSAYYKIGKQVADWLSVVEECQINTSSQSISQSLKDIKLDDDEELISFDVVSLYTNVPVDEAITRCAELLYGGRYQKPPVSKETFIKLTELCSLNVLMLTPRGYYRQKDGLAMGSPPAPYLANGWLSQFDDRIRGDAKVFGRYMDDVLRNIKVAQIESKSKEINDFHPNLKFTYEREDKGSIPFLDMRILHSGDKLTSTWYTKNTDTGLTMNYHALAPSRFKKSNVTGMVHRIHRACSTPEHFKESLEKAKLLLRKNQYPPSFYEPIIKKTIEKISKPAQIEEDKEEQPELKKFFIRYRGQITEQFVNGLKKSGAPVQAILTIRKLKTVLPSLKAPVAKPYKGWVVYQINCSRCQSCYVGQTARHLLSRIREHRNVNTPVGNHFNNCNVELTMDDVKIIARSNVSEFHLMALEALCIQAIKPSLNTKDEYKSRTLVIRI